jgi:sugar (pentulose or hexulose) kinase
MQIGAIQGAEQGWILDHADKLLFVPDLLLFFLTGTVSAEYTIASVSQLFSFSCGDFSRELLNIFGLRRSLFGPVVKPGGNAGTIIGGVGGEKKLESINVISVCEHDTASAYCASPFSEKKRMIISSGTWSLMGCELDAPLITEEGFRWNFANEGGYPEHHRFLRNVMGSWIIQEIRSGYREQGKNYTYTEIEKEAEAAAPFAYFIDVDDDLFFSPGDMAAKIHGYCLKRYTTAPENMGALVRCVYESLSMKYRRNLELLQNITGQQIAFINIIGGGARDRLMCRFTAGACRLPVAAGPEEATALGNILVQLIAAGEIKNLEEGRSMIAASFPPTWYEPENTGPWEEQYHRYREMFPLTGFSG